MQYASTPGMVGHNHTTGWSYILDHDMFWQSVWMYQIQLQREQVYDYSGHASQ